MEDLIFDLDKWDDPAENIEQLKESSLTLFEDLFIL